ERDRNGQREERKKERERERERERKRERERGAPPCFLKEVVNSMVSGLLLWGRAEHSHSGEHYKCVGRKRERERESERERERETSMITPPPVLQHSERT